MITFEKIKTASDKRFALDKRQKLVANDYHPGDIILFSEKVDGYNTSFMLDGRISSRNGIIRDWLHHAPIAGIQELVNSQEFIELIKAYPEEDFSTGRHQFFGEYMVENRLIPYQDFVYGGFYMFDIYDMEKECYLGIRAALALVEYLHENLTDESLKARLLVPHILDDAYIFESYEALEAYAHSDLTNSRFSISGTSEGVVTSNLSRKVPSEIRTKIVNQEYKEVQREMQKPARTPALRWLMTYLTDARVKKHILNLEIEGLLDRTRDDYYTDQLQRAVKVISDDIFTEAQDIIELSDKDHKDIFNKIEGFTRLIMIEYKTY